jgi:hypothetical protein
MSNKMVLTEYYALCDGGVCQDLLTEEEKRDMAAGKKFYMTGIMQRADAKNGNGRIYGKNVLQREVENYHKLVKERRALGELDHPDDSVINLRNASHLVTDIWWDGDDVMGKVQVLDTPAGKVLQELAKAGVTLGISSRGLGSVKEERGNTIVEDDFQLICFDFVSEPSTTGAFMMKESREPNIFTKSDKINRLLNDILRN